MSTVNLYDVLNLTPNCSQDEIKDSYRKLVLEFHPDRPGGDAELFELITHAYTTLKDPIKRKEYDKLYKLSKQSEADHFSLKESSRNYIKAQKNNIIKKSKKEQEEEFQKTFEELDIKHGIKRYDEKSIPEKEAKKIYKDIKLIRKQQDIENIQEKIFEDGRFDIEKFNRAFDELHKSHNELIPHTGNPNPYNIITNLDTNFSSFDDYDKLYVEDEDIQSSSYSSIHFDNNKNKKLTKKDIEKLSGTTYTKNHNFKDETYNKSIEEKLRERDLETKKLEDRSLEDFDTDPSCGGYGIFKDIDIDDIDKLELNDEGNIKTRYKKLLEMRK